MSDENDPKKCIRVRIEADGTPWGTKVTDVGTGRLIDNIVAVDLKIRAAEFPSATIELICPSLGLLVDATMQDKVREAWETRMRQALQAGAGLSLAEETGASLFWLWLRDTYLPTLRKP